MKKRRGLYVDWAGALWRYDCPIEMAKLKAAGAVIVPIVIYTSTPISCGGCVIGKH